MAENGITEVVVISGSQTLPWISETHAALLLRLSNNRSIIFDYSAVTGVGVSFIQVLIAAARFAATAGKRLLLSEPASGPFRAALERGDFLTSSEKLLSDEKAFWLQRDCTA